MIITAASPAGPSLVLKRDIFLLSLAGELHGNSQLALQSLTVPLIFS